MHTHTHVLTLSLMWMLVKYSDGTWKSKRESELMQLLRHVNEYNLQILILNWIVISLLPMSWGRQGDDAQGDANLG